MSSCPSLLIVSNRYFLFSVVLVPALAGYLQQPRNSFLSTRPVRDAMPIPNPEPLCWSISIVFPSVHGCPNTSNNKIIFSPYLLPSILVFSYCTNRGEIYFSKAQAHE